MRHFLFDLDGTLVDSFPRIIDSSQHALTELGATVSREQIVALIGIPLVETGERLLGPGMGQRYFDTYQKYFYRSKEPVRPFAGIPELLAELQASQDSLVIVTSKRRESALHSLREAGLDAYFSLIVTADDTPEHKPAAAPARYALAQLGAGQALFIGDSIFDMGCARAAGIAACGVTWGAAKAEELQAAGADFIARQVSELAHYCRHFGQAF